MTETIRVLRTSSCGMALRSRRAGKLLAAGNYVVRPKHYTSSRKIPTRTALECAAAAKSDFIISEDKFPPGELVVPSYPSGIFINLVIAPRKTP